MNIGNSGNTETVKKKKSILSYLLPFITITILKELSGRRLFHRMNQRFLGLLLLLLFKHKIHT